MEGHVTLEFSNTTNLPAKIYANEGVAQMLFLQSDEACEVSYKDRGGKYQGQRGVTLPKPDARAFRHRKPGLAPGFSCLFRQPSLSPPAALARLIAGGQGLMRRRPPVL